VDKLISIAEHNRIEPVIIVGKSDLSPKHAAELQALYQKAGFASFCVSCEKGDGIDAVADYIRQHARNKLSAFAGASGVGKSTLMNRLFPSLSRLTGDISQKNARGRHTTREVTLFSLSDLWPDCPDADGYIADTPGFSLLDFTRFDFFEKDDLPATMRDFAPYLGKCRWADCTHLKEEGCAVLQAVRRGDIAPSRHESFVTIYNDLKDKHPWSKAPSHH
jgi:ribosome biogenesis GTPase